MKLDFAIIGGQKCGSTYLHHVISEHPEVEMVSGESPQFEDPDYHYHETIFVYFENANRPSASEVEKAINKLRYKITDQQETDGALESITVVSDQDFAAMDIAYVDQEEVQSSLEELLEELKTAGLDSEEKAKADRLASFDARLDVFHFEKVIGEEEGEMLNPGALLLVLNSLCKLTSGVAIDPQSLMVY